VVSNGLPFRRDIHRLFDLGFVSVRPDLTFVVIKALRDDWRNGRAYYELEGSGLRSHARRRIVPMSSSSSGTTTKSSGGEVAAVKEKDKDKLRAELLRIGEETREFDYIPSRYLQDVANSDPAELVYKYVLAKDLTDGFQRLWAEGRLDLTVENVAWRHRRLFPTRVGRVAAERLAEAGFDVRTQTQRPR
jgi:hypothetical protein